MRCSQPTAFKNEDTKAIHPGERSQIVGALNVFRFGDARPRRRDQGHGGARAVEHVPESFGSSGEQHVCRDAAQGKPVPLPFSEIEIETDEKNISSIRSGSSFFKIHGLAAEEFPPLPKFKDDKKVGLQQETVRAMLKKTSFAVSTDESRYVLNGIFVSLKDGKMTLVATDGRRLALVDEEVEISEKSTGEFIVPAKAINELNRLLQDKGEVELKFGENQASFALKDDKGFSVLLITKLIEGNYPNYRQVIPGEAKERIPINREELLQALRRAEIMTSEKANSVKMTFGKNQLAITANSPEVGEARETLAVNYKGKEMAIAFNPRYLIDPLAALSEDEVFIELIDELSPGVLKINGPFLYVVMPMRLS